MFDSYVLRQPDVHHHTTVNQLPHDTADAARLYGEMVKKAEAEVRSAVLDRFGANNELCILKVMSETSFATELQRTRVLFRLAGRDHDIYVENDSLARTKLLEAIGKAVAAEVVARLSSTAPRR